MQSTLYTMNRLSQRYNIYVITVNDADVDFLESLSDYHVKRLKTLRGRVKLFNLLNPFTIIELYFIGVKE